VGPSQDLKGVVLVGFRPKRKLAKSNDREEVQKFKEQQKGVREQRRANCDFVQNRSYRLVSRTRGGYSRGVLVTSGSKKRGSAEDKRKLGFGTRKR